MFKIIIYILLALAAFVAVQIIRRKRIESKQYKEFLLIFKNQNISLPTLKFGSSYSWPTFTVTFANQVDYEFAEKHKMFDLFDSKIESFYDSDFKADMAIYYKYPGKKITAGGIELEV